MNGTVEPKCADVPLRNYSLTPMNHYLVISLLRCAWQSTQKDDSGNMFKEL